MNEEEEKKGRKKTIKENRSNFKIKSIKSKYVLLFLVLHI